MLWKLQETCPHNKIQAREVQKRFYTGINLKHNHNHAQASVAPTQPQYFHLGTQVQVGHTYNAWFVVKMIISGRIVNKIISAPSVDQDHMLHICAEYQYIKVGTITSVYIVVAHTTPQVIASVSPMTTEKNPGLHQGISTAMDHTTEQMPKIWKYSEEMHRILQVSGQHSPNI